ncbi:MAG: SDR family NAD(P)-dependent oxidoreductase [Saprospiraceae bacterium]|nr:MAG: SDR family NAD(P)-dependent oxidoreductase [Saprospiraceae bacterium]
MHKQKHHVLAHCVENQHLAREIISDLSKAGYQLSELALTNDVSEGLLENAFSQTRGIVLLLITDNFLKTEGCMFGALDVVKKLGDARRLIPVIADGEAPNSDGTGKMIVPTSFEKVSSIIKYLNHWQQIYLALRQNYQANKKDETLEAKIQTVKAISSDIGELLRYLRSQRCYSLQEFQADSYNSFFSIMGDTEGYEKLKKLLMTEHSEDITGDEKTLIELIEHSSDDLIAENLELDLINKKKLLEEPGDIPSAKGTSAIPGLNYLDELLRAAIRETSEKKSDKEPQKVEEHEEEKGSLKKGDEITLEQLSHLDKTPQDPIEALLEEVLAEEEDREFDPPEEEDAGNIKLEDIFILDDEEEEVVAKPLNIEMDKPKPNKKKYPTAEEALSVAIGLFEAGQKDQAIGFLQGAVEGCPNDPALRYYHAYALARYSQNFEEANKQLNLLISKFPTYADAWFLMAELSEIEKDFETAKSQFEKVATLNPEYPGVQYRLGLLLMNYLGQQELAASYFEDTIARDPANSDAHYRLATLCSEHLNNPGKAVEHFKLTLKQNPNHPFAYYDLAMMYHRMGEKMLAHQFYLKATELNPEFKTTVNDAAFGLLENERASMLEHLPAIEITQPSPVADEELLKEEIAAPVATQNPLIKTVLITGATSGIGRATAEIFACNGYRVIVTGRRSGKLDEMKSKFADAYQAEVLPLTFDVRDPKAVEEAIANLPEEWKKVDILINNAGLSKGLVPINEGKIEHWEAMIDTNIKGLLYLTRAISPQMVARKEGHIINIASSAGKEVYPGGNVYCATKFAVDALTQAMRLDLYKHNIRVSQVAPGHVEETEFARVRFDWDTEKADKVYDGFQPLRAADVAGAIYFIATRPPHVNIQDILMFGTQQAGSNFIDRSGR